MSATPQGFQDPLPPHYGACESKLGPSLDGACAQWGPPSDWGCTHWVGSLVLATSTGGAAGSEVCSEPHGRMGDILFSPVSEGLWGWGSRLGSGAAVVAMSVRWSPGILQLSAWRHPQDSWEHG